MRSRAYSNLRTRLLQTVMMLIVATLLHRTVVAQQPIDTRLTVTVQCEGVDHLEGVALRVLAPASSGGMLGLTPITDTFDADGKCTVRVPKGRFRFEVLYRPTDSDFVALKSELLAIAKDQTVTLVGLPPQGITLEIEDEGLIPLVECAIRFDSAIGEVAWKAKQQPGADGVGSSHYPSPRVIACKDQQYRVRLIGRRDIETMTVCDFTTATGAKTCDIETMTVCDFTTATGAKTCGSLHAAIWGRLDGDDWAVQVKRRDLSVGTFVIKDGGPEVDRAEATFAFPDARIDIDVTEDTRIMTNRRFLSYAYLFSTKQGQVITVQPQLGLVPRKQVYSIGGKFTPVAWSNVMKAKQMEKTTTHFTWGADLVDPNGYIVDTRRSQINWEMTGRTPNGEIQQDITIPDEQSKLYSDPRRALRVDVSYDLGQGPMSGTLTPVTFRPYSIPGFKTTAPPHWQLQAANYLAKARRVYGCIEEVEGKSGEHTTEIRWHKANGIAWGTVGGKSAWIMMPFAQLQGNFDHYAEPWALPHEMLHNFKHVHGDKMNAANSATIHKLKLFRWYMADHPELSPGDALSGFRKFQRGAPLNVQ